jgi:hypothetical protein
VLNFLKFYSLDLEIKTRYGIGNSFQSLQQRLEKIHRDMYNINIFLTYAAEQYDIVESNVVTRSSSIGAVSGVATNAVKDTKANSMLDTIVK